MVASALKAILSFYPVNSDMAFERHRSRIPINDLNTVHTLKKHIIQFLGLKELTIKIRPWRFRFRALSNGTDYPGGKVPRMLDDSGSEIISMYS